MRRLCRYVQKGIVLTVNLAATQDVRLKIGTGKAETISVTADAELINTSSAELARRSMKPPSPRCRSTDAILRAWFCWRPHCQRYNHGGEGIQTGFSFPTETGASAAAVARAAHSTCSTRHQHGQLRPADLALPELRRYPGVQGHHQQLRRAVRLCARRGVSIATKSGTNQFHGGAFWYIRNNDLNATDWFSHQTDTLRRNQFGAFAGGPIKKDKLFFFANYQGTKIIWNSNRHEDLHADRRHARGRLQRPGLGDRFRCGHNRPECPSRRSAACPTSSIPTFSTYLRPRLFAKYGMLRSSNIVANTAALTTGVQRANGDMMYTYPTVHKATTRAPQAGLQPLALADPLAALV